MWLPLRERILAESTQPPGWAAVADAWPAVEIEFRTEAEATGLSRLLKVQDPTRLPNMATI